MKLSLMMRGQHPPSAIARHLAEDLELVRCADRLGFEGIVKGSHYSAHPFESLQQIPFLAYCAVYVLQRQDPPVLVYQRDGTFVESWGTGEIADPHGLKIAGDVVYTTDRTGPVAKSFTLGGKLLLELGQRGVYSDTGCTGAPWLAVRASGPFNHPTEMNAHPNGDIYVTDVSQRAGASFLGRRDIENVVGRAGLGSRGVPFPHCVVFDESGRLYVADRANRRIAGRGVSGRMDRLGRAERHRARRRWNFLCRQAGA